VTQRAPYEPLEELPSMPRRDLRRDDRFDVIETFELTRAPAAAPVNPRIVSSAHGPIRHLMLWYSEETEENKPYRTVFSDLMRLLPSETRITMVVHPSSAADAEALATERAGQVDIVTAPDWLAFTVWAEDACVVVEDASADPPITYLVEPFAFPRLGDEVVADLVAQATSLQSTQLPLIFQGGNVLIGDDFVLIGRDYLDQSIRSHFVNGQLRGFPETAPQSEQQAWVRDLFRRTFDPERELHFLESDPTGRPGNALFEHQGQVWLDHVDAGWGDRQPIFHIDMFVSLAGRDQRTGRYRVLVGDPTVANEMLGWQPEPHDLAGEFDAIAAQLEALDFDVRRTPLVHTFAPELRPGAVTTPDGGTAEFVARRRWYHATANNCLVQIDGDRHDVWVPTYGHEPRENLTPVDARHKAIWEGLGFTVHQLGDFHQFAFNQGALHCIKKYLSR
jgi:hypothetical protein